MTKCVMFIQKPIVPPNSKAIEDYTVKQFFDCIEGKAIPMRVGLTIVGYVTKFTIVGDKVVGEFREGPVCG